MTEAQQGNNVKVHYTGKLDDGTVFDTSAGREPIEFTIGGGQIIPGFERAVIGMNQGESKTAVIPADEAYGPHRDDMVIEVEREQFPPNVDPQVGQQFQMRQGDEAPLYVTVTDVTPTLITLDANHPLAGKDLIFDIQLVDVK